MTTFEKIKKRAISANISLVQLCKDVGISRRTLECWKKKEPQTIIFLNKINEALANAEEKNYQNMIDKTLNETK